MKTKFCLAIAAALACATALAEHDYQGYENGIGDWNVLTLGGYTIAKPTTVDLAPTNAPDASAQYSLCCQVIYRDNLIPRPKSCDELDIVIRTGVVLNWWLEDFIASEYAGGEYADLLEKYKSGAFATELNAKFSAHVAEQISKIEDPRERPDIDTVTVTVTAEGAFRAALIEEMIKASQEAE